ncbi:hypothetical protein SLEP1_g19821 [Rubroshorea leprosula]|uniref:Uncharacterized protein n=1 Tax=Rubroshorea leprosula TaxID=152421 RepID=A0AAV5J6L3_9ROSI|nr:hypothetical protein SLEP1_g19821 [Rubroshorea leprosula]
MGSFSGLGIGLGLVFGCLLLALVAELFYLLWWKKRITRREIEDDYSNHAKELIQLFCWKKSPSRHTPTANGSSQETVKDTDANGDLESDPELGSNKDLLLKAFGGEEGVEAELMRLHNLAGPPRFLFTIKEETKEDLESDDGRSRGDRSRKGSRTGSFMGDLVLTVDNPFLSPLASPHSKTPLSSLYSYHHHGFNPLFESSTEAELNRLRSSPPPKFKFLRDAEEKLLRRLMEEAEKKVQKTGGSVQDSDTVKPPDSPKVVAEVIEGSFLKFIAGKNKEPLQYLPQYPSSSSQVLPLASSPTTL